MKNLLRTMTAIAAILTLVLNLSSCTLFKTLRANAEKQEEIIIYPSPDEKNTVKEFNGLLEKSLRDAKKINESIKYSAGTPDIMKDGEEAGLLDDAAKQLKNLIMDGKPGKESRTVKDAEAEPQTDETASSLLKAINEADVLSFSCERNITEENVTNEKGKEIIGESGEAETTRYISDNTAHFTFNYFNVLNSDGTVYEEQKDKKDGEDEEATTVVYADDSVIVKAFGPLKDSGAVLKNFEVWADYIKVDGYSVKYNECRIKADADLDAKNLSYVTLSQDMTVTAKAQGAGALSEYGELEIEFSITKTVDYSFEYSPAEPTEE